jgi:hypothetical protein
MIQVILLINSTLNSRKKIDIAGIVRDRKLFSVVRTETTVGIKGITENSYGKVSSI